MKMKKVLSIIMAAVMGMGLLGGCGESKTTNADETVVVVGNWPDSEAMPDLYESMMKLKEEFETKNPGVIIEGDSWAYDTETFAAKAEGGTLPTIYNTFATESQKIMELGYAADITDQMKKFGYYDTLSEQIMNEVSDDGKVYIIPRSVYTLGLVMNLNLFREAGLMNADGTPIFPETFDDVRSMAKTITEKTGKAGFLFPTTSEAGGWNFTSLAWSFGGEFMKETEKGWVADFNDGTTAALQLLKDMRWKDKSLPETTLINNAESMKLIGTDQAAMAFAHPGQLALLTSQYGMSTDDIGYAKMPKGPAAHVTMLGGDYTAFAPNATPEQIEAGFKWLEFTGVTPAHELTDEVKESVRNSIKMMLEGNRIVGIKDISIWTDKDVTQKYRDEITEENRNIPEKNISSYNDKTGLEFRTEEKVCAQDLYSLLDGCIQEVLTNENADPKTILKKAESDFQNNFLNKAK